MTYDVIIIGAGLGGLVSGAKLAKQGKKILLVEQHDRPGGCATTFKRKDYTFEVGLHEMDGLTKADMKIKIFRDLGVFDEVEFLRVPEFYHFKNNRYNITIPHEIEEAVKVLTLSFPEEKEGITAYFDQLINIKKKIKEAKGEPEISLGEFLDSIIKNEDLKLILLGNLGYYHDDPYSVSLTYYSMAQSSYYLGGGNFIKGGSQKLSDYLSDYITEKGGKVLLKHTVTDILTEKNKAIGISFKENKNNATEKQSAYSKFVVANAAIPNVAKFLLPKEEGDKLMKQIEPLENAASLLTIYLGFNKKLKNIGSKYYSTFVFDDSIKKQADIKKNNKGDFKNRSFTFVDYSQVDSALCAEDKSVGVICCVDYYSDWEKLTKEEYQTKKKEVGEIYIEKLEKLIPGIKEHIDYYEVGTSKTVERYTMNPKGAVYGFAQTPNRVKHDTIKSINNLHFASAWTKVGGGFSGAIFSGYLCAMEIIRKDKPPEYSPF